jgi:phage host-nuclease inhibitor protein Gam
VVSVNVRDKLNVVARIRSVGELQQRVADLEADMSEMRQHNLRLAEIADVIQELLIPLASRDQVKVQEAIERFNKSL